MVHPNTVNQANAPEDSVLEDPQASVVHLDLEKNSQLIEHNFTLLDHMLKWIRIETAELDFEVVLERSNLWICVIACIKLIISQKILFDVLITTTSTIVMKSWQ